MLLWQLTLEHCVICTINLNNSSVDEQAKVCCRCHELHCHLVAVNIRELSSCPWCSFVNKSSFFYPAFFAAYSFCYYARRPYMHLPTPEPLFSQDFNLSFCYCLTSSLLPFSHPSILFVSVVQSGATRSATVSTRTNTSKSSLS